MSIQIEDELLESNYWNTNKVNELLYKAEEEGLDFKSVDNPFHDSDPSLKRANILYEYTREEILEIEKCSKDAVYFSKYCQVMTDDGLQYIRLRDYQVSVIKEYQANRFNVFLAPRQVGKSRFSGMHRNLEPRIHPVQRKSRRHIFPVARMPCGHRNGI